MFRCRKLSTDNVAGQAKRNIHALFSHFTQCDVLGSFNICQGTITLTLRSFLCFCHDGVSCLLGIFLRLGNDAASLFGSSSQLLFVFTQFFCSSLGILLGLVNV